MPKLGVFEGIEDRRSEITANVYYYECLLIRQDSIEEFVSYVNKTNFPLTGIICNSIYETNNYLVRNVIDREDQVKQWKNVFRKEMSLLEYAAFFGSIKIFNYLITNGVKLTSFLWPFAVHGNNSEIIYQLINDNIAPYNDLYIEMMIESIRCHHNEIADFIQSNFLSSEKEDLTNIFRYYNFSLMKEEFINPSSFCALCKYNYYEFVDFLVKNTDIHFDELEIRLIVI